MPEKSHLPFAVINRTANQAVKLLLRSPLERVQAPVERWFGWRLALITVTGRRSGRNHTFPVGYRRHGGMVQIEVDFPARKLWWRNLLEPAPVQLRIGGEELTGSAVAHGDPESGVTVEVMLD